MKRGRKKELILTCGSITATLDSFGIFIDAEVDDNSLQRIAKAGTISADQLPSLKEWLRVTMIGFNNEARADGWPTGEIMTKRQLEIEIRKLIADCRNDKIPNIKSTLLQKIETEEIARRRFLITNRTYPVKLSPKQCELIFIEIRNVKNIINKCAHDAEFSLELLEGVLKFVQFRHERADEIEATRRASKRIQNMIIGNCIHFWINDLQRASVVSKYLKFFTMSVLKEFGINLTDLALQKNLQIILANKSQQGCFI